jgi:hypothetical protein
MLPPLPEQPVRLPAARSTSLQPKGDHHQDDHLLSGAGRMQLGQGAGRPSPTRWSRGSRRSRPSTAMIATPPSAPAACPGSGLQGRSWGWRWRGTCRAAPTPSPPLTSGVLIRPLQVHTVKPADPVSFRRVLPVCRFAGRPRLIQVRYFALPILSITAPHTHIRPCCILALRSARLCLGGAPPSECRSNALGPDGATVVASFLRSLTALRDLDMWCGLC